MNKRRLVRVPVSLELLVELCKSGHEVSVKVTDGLPENAEFVCSTFDATGLTAYLVFYSPLFEEVLPHAEIPIKAIALKKLEKSEYAGLDISSFDPIIPEDIEE